VPARVSLVLTAVALLGWTAPACAQSVSLPNGTVLKEVSFERHVAGLLGKMGCNSGACHGSFQGKGGLYLSLFGHAPAKDYRALTRDGMGRRVNVAEPDSSLLLLKATAQVSHGGGKRFDKDSWPYHVVREWIAGGAKWQGGGAIARVEVLPKEHRLQHPGETLKLRVVVEFADSTEADLTPFCDFRAKDDTIAEVSPLGEVRGLRPGDTPVIVSYQGHLVAARVLVPAPADDGFVYPTIPEVNALDHEVFAKLRMLNITPSELSDDAEFLRRVTVDTIGCLPSPEEVRAFLADRAADKRAQKIDTLLAHPLRAALWATKFSDITGNNVDIMDGPPELRAKKAKMWHDWFRKRLADNVPYDQIVHGVLCATSRDDLDLDHWIQREVAENHQLLKGFDSDYARRPSLDLFWRRTAEEDFFPLEQMAELTSAAFLGVRLECAQCHKHPYDRWTQADYRRYANVFSQVKFGSSPAVTAAVTELLAERRKLPPEKAGPPIPRLREVYVSNHLPRRLPHPETNQMLPPRVLGGPEISLDGDAREQLFRWLVQPDNPFFARSFVNRVWAHYLGIGLVEPVDNFSVANPPSNEKLLEALAKEFVQSNYDIRRLERSILRSRTYQLSSLPNASNRRDRTNYSHAAPRRMMAEVVLDVLNSALGALDDFSPSAPPGSRAVEVATNRVGDAHLSRVFRIFGRPARTSTCDCERPTEPALPQTLFLMTDSVLLKRITDGRLKTLLAEKKTDDEVIEELFLATLCRFPDDKEKRAALEHVKSAEDRRAGFVDMLWALINTREFILNH
jgi:Protein of unknown function (DUF1553)/Protein of unknown function (DUF1549)